MPEFIANVQQDKARRYSQINNHINKVMRKSTLIAITNIIQVTIISTAILTYYQVDRQLRWPNNVDQRYTRVEYSKVFKQIDQRYAVKTKSCDGKEDVINK